MVVLLANGVLVPRSGDAAAFFEGDTADTGFDVTTVGRGLFCGVIAVVVGTPDVIV